MYALYHLCSSSYETSNTKSEPRVQSFNREIQDSLSAYTVLSAWQLDYLLG